MATENDVNGSQADGGSDVTANASPAESAAETRTAALPASAFQAVPSAPGWELVRN